MLTELSANNTADYYLHVDHQGSIMAKSNASGTVEAYARYDPFGARLQVTSDVPFGFAGTRYDPQGEHCVLGVRRYDPVQGRFTTRDTRPSNVWDPWTWNLYTYCKSSQQNCIDPTGHTAEYVAVEGVTGRIPTWLGLQATAGIVGAHRHHA